MTKTHRPFLFMAVFFGLGIVVDHYAGVPFSGCCFLTGAFLAAGCLWTRKPFLPTVFLLMALTGSGMGLSQVRSHIGKNDIRRVAKYYSNHPVAVKGIIRSPVEVRQAVNGRKTTFTLSDIELNTKWGWKKYSGSILINVFRELEVVYGDRILLEGKLHKPYNFSSQENFSYRDFLSHQGIGYILSVKKSAEVRVLSHGGGSRFKFLSLKGRGYFQEILSSNLTANEAGIMQAVLLGDRTGIPKYVRTLFVQTGTAHILAISGLHIGIAAGIFMVFAKFFPIGRRAQLGGVIILLIGYCFLTGGRPSIVRATIMLAVFLSSLIIEKEPDIINSLCLAAFIILVYNPLNIFDIGFQLSFICVYSILYANLKMKIMIPFHLPFNGEKSVGRHLMGFIVRSLYISLAIWIGACGLIVYYFGIISPVAIIANLLIVPLLSIIVPLGFCLLGLGMVIPAWTFMAAACLKVVLNLMVGLIYVCAKIPFAYIYIDGIGKKHILAYYSVLIFALIFPWGRFFDLYQGICQWARSGFRPKGG